MREVGIVGENTSDISPAIARELDLAVAPFTMITDGEENLITLDGDRSVVIDRVAACTKFGTAGVNVQDFLDAFTSMREKARSLVAITLAPEFSVTYNSTVTASEMLEDTRCKVFDSRLAFVAVRTIIVQAARRALGGATFEEVCSFVERAIPVTEGLIISPNLTYVRIISRLTEGKDAPGGEMRLAILRIKDGKAVPIDAAADYGEAIDKVMAHAAKVAPPGSPIYAALAHVRQPEVEEQLRQRVATTYRVEDLTRTEESALGMLVGGLGMVAVGICPAM